jgi:hypothetical protein
MSKKLKNQYKNQYKNQSILNNTNYDLIVKTSQIENSGRGVFLSENSKISILENDIIGFYMGEWKINDRNTSNYSFYINEKLVIDIDFSNHSNPIPITAIFNDAIYSDYSNNIFAKILLEEDEIKKINKKNCENYDVNKIVGLYASHNIYPGEELFFDYGSYYWKSW